MIFNPVVQSGGGNNPKEQLIAWIKENGESTQVNASFAQLNASANVDAYNGMYFAYAEDSTGNEMFFVPWIYETASYHYAMDRGGRYYVTQDIELTIEEDASYHIRLVNTEQVTIDPFTLYVFPNVSVEMQ